MKLRHQLRRLCGAALVLVVVACAGASFGGELPENFSVQMVPNKSDDNLNAARIGCAFGDMPAIMQRVSAKGVSAPDVAAFCQAVVAEAIRRERQGHLYVRMQPENPLDELGRVFEAASNNANHYNNVEGVSKELPCTLAYDAGWVYESFKPSELDVPAMSSAKRQELRELCFQSAYDFPVINGLIVGVLDQRARE